jgi:hypothetical protein
VQIRFLNLQAGVTGSIPVTSTNPTKFGSTGTAIAICPLTLEKYCRRNVKAIAELFHLLPVELPFLLQD